MALGIFLQCFIVNVSSLAFEDNLTAQSSCVGTHVDEVVGCTHNLLVVFNNHNRVTQCLQVLEHTNQLVGVT